MRATYYVIAAVSTEFHIFASSGAASGRSTQLGFEVEDIDQAVDLRACSLEFESFDLGDLEVTDQIVAGQQLPEQRHAGSCRIFFNRARSRHKALPPAAASPVETGPLCSA